MRRLHVVERRETMVISASDEEGAIEEAVAMMVENADESVEPFTVLASYDEPEDEDQERSELVGELRALENELEWVENVHSGKEVRDEVEMHLRERIDTVSKSLLEMC